MRNYREITVKEQQLHQVFCNRCGKEIIRNNFGEFDDYLHIEKTWGYHSKKDGIKQEVDLCESCFDEIVKGFQIPLEECQ